MSVYYPTPPGRNVIYPVAGAIAGQAARRFADRAGEYSWQALQNAGSRAVAGVKRRIDSAYQSFGAPAAKRRGVARGYATGMYARMHRRPTRRGRRFGGRRRFATRPRNKGLRSSRAGFRVKKGGYGRQKVQTSAFSTRGSITKLEDGAVISDNNAVYIGVTSCPISMVQAGLGQVIIKELMRQQGQQFSSWDDTMGINSVASHDIRFGFYATPQALSETAGTITSILNTDTYAVIAGKFMTNLSLALASNPQMVLDSVQLMEIDGAVETARATIRSRNFYLDIDSHASISVQNRTLSGTGTTPSGETDQVTNNPVYGRVYYSGSNGFIPKFRAVTAINYESMVGDAITGVISTNAGNQGLDQYKKSPPGSFFKGCRSQARTMIAPGGIRLYNVHTRKSYSLNGMLQRFPDELASPTAKRHWELGNGVMVALEKVVDSRSDENGVSVGYEINQVFKIKSRYRARTVTAPIVTVM